MNIRWTGRFWWTGCVVIILVLGLSFSAQADVITFLEGETLHGEIYREEDNSIAIRLVTGGDVIVSRELIKSIIHEPAEVFYIKRGDYFLDRKEYEKALIEYIQADKRKPEQRWIDEKIKRVKRIQAEEIGQSLLSDARALAGRNQFRQAIAALEKAARECPAGETHRKILEELAVVHSRLAYHYFDHCFEELALEELVQAEEYNPYCPDIYYVLGRINHSQSRLQTARREYQRALELNPDMETAKDFLLKLSRDLDRVQRRTF